MEIHPGIEIIDLALHLKKCKTLVISDLHIGFEEALNKQGFFIPRFQLRELLKQLEKIMAKTKPEHIIINGDVKHEFGEVSSQEWRETMKVLDLLSKSAKVTLIKGNHDIILEPIAKKKNVRIVDNIMIDDVFLMHGHVEQKIPKKAKTIIIGHMHPAITIREGARAETYKCFLKGKYGKADLIVMPSFSSASYGTDITSDDLLGPYNKIRDFEAYVVSDGEILDFGKVKDIHKKI
ncbi:MAG: metallophosphoesterase [Candidatus Woesearchaeota archaeon]